MKPYFVFVAALALSLSHQSHACADRVAGEASVEKNIGGVNSTSGSQGVQGHYDNWRSYEADLAKVNYRLPEIMAEMITRFVPNRSQRLLDAGCGTGLSGAALAKQGYESLIGLDVTKWMLDVAGAKSRENGSPVYEKVDIGNLEATLPLDDNSVDHTISVGTIGVVKPVAMRELVRVTKSGGVIMFSNRTAEHFAAGAGFVTEQDNLVSEGAWEHVETFKGVVADTKPGSSPFVVFVYRKL